MWCASPCDEGWHLWATILMEIVTKIVINDTVIFSKTASAVW